MITDKDLEAFGYYDMVDAYPQNNSASVSDMVSEYNTTAGNKKDPKLYEGLIFEEFYEWVDEAFLTVEELKELADLVYVAYGYAWANGWDLDEAVRRVHENNMARMYQPDGTIKRRADGKVEKNPNTPKVQLDDLV